MAVGERGLDGVGHDEDGADAPSQATQTGVRPSASASVGERHERRPER